MRYINKNKRKKKEEEKGKSQEKVDAMTSVCNLFREFHDELRLIVSILLRREIVTEK